MNARQVAELKIMYGLCLIIARRAAFKTDNQQAQSGILLFTLFENAYYYRLENYMTA